MPFAAIRDHVDEIVTVSEESMSQALLVLSSAPSWSSSRPARPRSPRCSTTRAASRPRPSPCCPAATSTRCCSSKVIRHGLAAAGRYLNIRVCIPDLPGGLASLLAEVGAEGANVLEVAHERTRRR